MSKQGKLKANLRALRRLALKLKLEPETALDVHFAVQTLGDRCLYNQGWYSARPQRELKGRAATETLNNELLGLIALIEPFKNRGIGRPPKITEQEIVILTKHREEPGKKTLTARIDEAARATPPRLDPSISTATYRRRIVRHELRVYGHNSK
jgi:hypothetical protein